MSCIKMEEDVDKRYRKVCSTCLSTNRDLIIYEDHSDIYQIFRLLMYDFAGELVSLSGQSIQVCWECAAMMKRFGKFRKRVHTAQANFTVLSNADHAYISHSLSSLETITKRGYDRVYIDHTTKTLTEWSSQYISIGTTEIVKNESYDIAQVVRENINLELEESILGGMVLDNSSTVPHIVINAEPLASQETYKVNEFVLPELTIRPCMENNANILIEHKQKDSAGEKPDLKAGYLTEYMNEEDMLSFRELAKEKVQYASAVYKCELCILGFYNQQQVEEHYVSAHKARPGTVACKVCFVYVDVDKQANHTQSHYVRHVCRTCGYAESSARLAQLHVHAHLDKRLPSALIQIGDTAIVKKSRKRKHKEDAMLASKSEPQNLRKLLSKTTIVGYKCLECDMFFKNSRARKNHVARFHREGLQCDHCKKRFVNKTTLATHLKLHEGPPPRAECPICRKMVRAVQLKYHVQRHQSKGRYECADCNKMFSHLTTYHAHLKYSRAHASDQVFKFPCPMCNKGYPTKEAMQDHFNYQHLGKTSHKCPKCDKPIASKANVEKHMMRVHGEKKEKPRNHVCQQCGKGFTDKKALNQHEVIHSGDRPLSCDICHQTFKQKASLYTHKKRVHNVVPMKRVVEFIDTKNNVQN